MMHKLLWSATLFLIVAFGVGEGLWTDRWSWFEGPLEAAAKLRDIPRTVGDWDGRDQELDPRQIAQGGIVGHVARVYTNRVTGATVQVLLVCGSPGPMSVHTPEICYGGAGYRLTGEPTSQEVPATASHLPATFWAGQFEKAGPTPERLKIQWSWTATGNWTAPSNPRWSFGRHRFLYKLYVVCSQSTANEPAADDPVPGFLHQFLPEVQKNLLHDSSLPPISACCPVAPQLCAGRLS